MLGAKCDERVEIIVVVLVELLHDEVLHEIIENFYSTQEYD
jgi:hypothetical protein